MAMENRYARLFAIIVCLLLCRHACAFKCFSLKLGILKHISPIHYIDSSLLPVISHNRDIYKNFAVDRNQDALKEKTLFCVEGCNKDCESNGPNFVDYFILGTVPILWGTYGPIVKTLYSSAAVPPPAVVFNLLSYLASVYTFNFIGLFQTKKKLNEGGGNEDAIDHTENNERSKLTLRVGVELGLWLFLGSSAQVMGIQGTTASRAGVLVQLTTIIVPILESTSNKKQLDDRLWIATLFAVVGILCVSIESPAKTIQWLSYTIKSGSFRLPGALSGDFLVLLSAFFYSMHVLRLGKFAQFVDTFTLAKIKAKTELICAVFVSSFLLLTGDQECMNYISVIKSNFSMISFPILVGTSIWNGALPTAYTMWAQATGQRKIGPTEANLIYTSQPIWSAIFAFILLGETFSSHEVTGCAFLALAAGLSLKYGPGFHVSKSE